jgi:4-amino-4-deoxy-L-arabinose transferase-like glycosyltransferase
MLPFLVVLLAASWIWMRRWYGDAAAVAASVFLVSTPVILGHAGVVAVDVPVTAMMMLALYLLLRWFEAPRSHPRYAWGWPQAWQSPPRCRPSPFSASPP